MLGYRIWGTLKSKFQILKMTTPLGCWSYEPRVNFAGWRAPFPRILDPPLYQNARKDVIQRKDHKICGLFYQSIKWYNRKPNNNFFQTIT